MIAASDVVRILAADDHSVFQERLALHFRARRYDMRPTEMASIYGAAVRKIPTSAPMLFVTANQCRAEASEIDVHRSPPTSSR